MSIRVQPVGQGVTHCTIGKISRIEADGGALFCDGGYEESSPAHNIAACSGATIRLIGLFLNEVPATLYRLNRNKDRLADDLCSLHRQDAGVLPQSGL